MKVLVATIAAEVQEVPDSSDTTLIGINHLSRLR